MACRIEYRGSNEMGGIMVVWRGEEKFDINNSLKVETLRLDLFIYKSCLEN